MKKINKLVFAVLCAAAILSCTKETFVEIPAEEQATTPSGQTILNPITLTFETSELTKVAISNEGTASWEEGDQVRIICFNAEGQSWTSDSLTVFDGKITGTVEDAEVYYAVYPASATIALEKVSEVDNLKVTIASEQNGTFKNACYYAAKTTKAAKTFNFKAISGILKFQAGSEYKTMDIRDVEKADERHAFADTETCTFDADGNVTVTPVSNKNSMITVSLDGNGTYYAAICGNAENRAVFRFSKDSENPAYEPGVYYNNLIQYVPTKIKNFGNLTAKIVTDVYVSPEGAGNKDGLTPENAAPASDLVEACLDNEEVSYTAVKGLLKNYSGIWNCYRRDGLTIHFAKGEYSNAFKVEGNNSPFKLTLQGEEGTVLKGANTVSAENEGTITTFRNLTFTSSSAKALSVSAGVCNLDSCNFISCSNTTGDGAALVLAIKAQVTAKNCIFQQNKAKNGPALYINSGKASSYNFVIFSAENCVFGGKDKDDISSGNEASVNGGAVFINAGAQSGQVRFNNCRFGSNKVTATTSNGSVFYSNATTAVLFNGCTFHKNTHSSNSNNNSVSGYTIYGGVNSIIGFNNCTWNVQAMKDCVNGSEIVLLGSSVVANSTIWGSGETGKRAMAHIGSKTSLSNATIVNSVVHQKSSTYCALYLTKDYYLKMSGSIYDGLNDDKTAVSGTNYVFDNCFDRGLSNSSFAGLANGEAAKNGVTHYYYTYTFNSTTYSDFTPTPLPAVKDAVKNTAGIGEIFDSWLTEIGAYDKDILGNTRNADAMSPGSMQISWSD